MLLKHQLNTCINHSCNNLNKCHFVHYNNAFYLRVQYLVAMHIFVKVMQSQYKQQEKKTNETNKQTKRNQKTKKQKQKKPSLMSLPVSESKYFIKCN